MSYVIGVDIGGTKTAIGIVDQKGIVISQMTLPTDQTISPTEMIDRMIDTIHKLLKEKNVEVNNLKGIGIGAPGPLDVKNGMITCPPNLKHWIDIPIVEQFKSNFELPIVLENDASAAALAEKWVGAAKGTKDFIYVTISTGIGAGIVVDGKLYTGARGNAGDIGHMVVDPRYGECTCGQYGCFEWVASGTAIARMGSEIMREKITTKDVFELYEQGNEQIVEMLNDVIKCIGIGCVSLINTIEPEKIVIGGGVSKVGDALFKPVREYVATHALSPWGRKTEIVPAKPEGNSGLIGAAALVVEQL